MHDEFTFKVKGMFFDTFDEPRCRKDVVIEFDLPVELPESQWIDLDKYTSSHWGWGEADLDRWNELESGYEIQTLHEPFPPLFANSAIFKIEEIMSMEYGMESIDFKNGPIEIDGELVDIMKRIFGDEN